MSKKVKLICCNKTIQNTELWFLSDIKNFTDRKLYLGVCPHCFEDVAMLFEKRISDNKIFINELTGIEAVKTMYREKKRKLTVIPNIKPHALYGWVYGVNTQIKNKKGEVTQIRQYASDFSNNKVLVKTDFKT